MEQKKWQETFPKPTKRFRERTEATLASLPDPKENQKMKLKKRLIIPVMALVALLALGTGIVATGNITTFVGYSSSNPTFTELPTTEQLNDKLDYTPIVIESFSNGYTFENAVIGTEKGLDEEGNTLDKHKDISVEYQKGNDEVSVFASKWNEPITDTASVIETYQDVELRYIAYANKCVPGDYVMTEQDKADEASGKYVFSFGVEKEEIDQVQSVVWVKGGINYDILAVNSDLTQEDLGTMAKEMLDK